MIASNTLSFHLVVVFALFQKIPSSFAVQVALEIQLLVSTPLFAASVSMVPKYSAAFSLVMTVPSENLMFEWVHCKVYAFPSVQFHVVVLVLFFDVLQQCI
jgi:hypothetical protein